MRKADNLPPYRAVVMKSGSLNFLEPSGPAQACYGRALPFYQTSRKSLYVPILQIKIYFVGVSKACEMFFQPLL